MSERSDYKYREKIPIPEKLTKCPEYTRCSCPKKPWLAQIDKCADLPDFQPCLHKYLPFLSNFYKIVNSLNYSRNLQFDLKHSVVSLMENRFFPGGYHVDSRDMNSLARDKNLATGLCCPMH
jgi:hypothetical protein